MPTQSQRDEGNEANEAKPNNGVSVGYDNNNNNNNNNSTPSADNDLPDWIVKYVTWHNAMRQQYPGNELFTNQTAPKLLIRVCPNSVKCGGLNDRLGQLPWDLYIANQTGRLFLIWWQSPKLDEFLIPNAIDWSVPPGNEKYLNGGTPRLFDNMQLEWNMRNPRWDRQVDEAIRQAINGTKKDERILTHRLTSHAKDAFFEKKLRALGHPENYDFIGLFGKLFRLFFRPNARVQEQVDSVSTALGLTPGDFTVVHLRVRYPVAEGSRVDDNQDYQGLHWSGSHKEMAISQGMHALRCSQTLLKRPDEKVYLMADSHKVVKFFAFATRAKPANETASRGSLEAEARQLAKSVNIVAREAGQENFHLDRQRGHQVSDYYSSFVDLLLASKARCVAYGQGRYGFFTAKLAGTTCQLWYQKESDFLLEPGKGHVPFCAQKANNTIEIIYPKA